MTTPPTRDDLPDELVTRDQWVAWRPQQRDGKQTKVPLNPATGRFASATDASTWGDFEQAHEYASGNADAGVGYVFAEDDPIVGVDLDDCRDPESGTIDAWAERVISTLDSYTEVSPSGTGLHVLVLGTLPGDRNRKGDIECYESARFFTMTGDRLDDYPGQIAARTDELRTIADELLTPDLDGNQQQGDGQHSDISPAKSTIEGNLADEELLGKARTATNGAKFRRLWNGSTAGYESHSEADMALCSLLAFWTGGDADQMDRLFRRSGLYRDKWDEPHYADGTTYGAKTIERAIAGTTEFYDPTGSDEVASSTAQTAAQPPQSDDTVSDAAPHDAWAEREATIRARIEDLEAEVERLERENDQLRSDLAAAEADAEDTAPQDAEVDSPSLVSSVIARLPGRSLERPPTEDSP